MALYGFIPTNKKKFDSVGIVHIPCTNRIDVMNAKNPGITVVAIESIIATTLEQHDIAVSSLRINNVLSPSNVVCGIIELGEIMMVDSVPFEEN